MKCPREKEHVNSNDGEPFKSAAQTVGIKSKLCPIDGREDRKRTSQVAHDLAGEMPKGR